MPPELTPNVIYAALCRRADGQYQWALTTARAPTARQKLHATNLDNPDIWCYLCEQ
ncbi:hypothetical protein GY45DRAFT_1258334 [Cubamyces sp. BRFM 1775]|nr:hypothetical protein GY45DRAFT_1258334 [Cubamyces sp. BRFM 1775]